ncbi:hypothetical protein [Paenibacillus rhizoplanae]|uniref:hypothetical protein n=1 Tax=Paenibacillus rhizoplanae TaxID=1917181 RepID=UPI003622E916
MRIQRITGKLLIAVLVWMSASLPGARISSAEMPPAQVIVEEHVNKSTVTEDTYQPSPLLWQVGEQDDSSAEFTVYQDVYSENITLPVNPLNWNTISRGMKLDRNAAMELSFNLTEVPLYGVEFSFKVLDASTAIPQLAVFTNGGFSGLIQITGLNDGETPPYEHMERNL